MSDERAKDLQVRVGGGARLHYTYTCATQSKSFIKAWDGGAGVKYDLLLGHEDLGSGELMMTGWLPEVGYVRACWQACRSCVRSEFGRRDLGGREGL